jgi:RNA polymerase sigma factor (sigma-70 family)
MASGNDDTTLPPDELFLKYLPVIERLIQHSVRRSYLQPEEAEDFASTVNLKLISNDYEVIRQWRGKCTFKTYLGVVIKRARCDYLDHLWGKWRPSAEAKSLGPLAIKLEQLLHKDEFTFDEACQILQVNLKVEISTQELIDLAAQLPPRTRRRKLGEEALQEAEAAEHSDGPAQEKERQAKRRWILESLKKVLKELPKDEQVIIDLKKKGVKIKAMSVMIGIEQKKLYRRVDGIMEKLRSHLQREGIGIEDVREILGD